MVQKKTGAKKPKSKPKKLVTDSLIPVDVFYMKNGRTTREEPGKYPFHAWNTPWNVP